MLVLIAVTLPIIVPRVLSGFDMEGREEYIWFSLMVILHSIAGGLSWSANYHTYGNRILWLLAVHVHVLVYTVQWDMYTSITLGDDGTFMVLGCIVMPSVLMFGAPFAAVIAPRRSAG